MTNNYVEWIERDKINEAELDALWMGVGSGENPLTSIINTTITTIRHNAASNNFIDPITFIIYLVIILILLINIRR